MGRSQIEHFYYQPQRVLNQGKGSPIHGSVKVNAPDSAGSANIGQPGMPAMPIVGIYAGEALVPKLGL